MVYLEKVKMGNLVIQDLLNEKFIESLKKNGLNIVPISLIFVGIEKRDNWVAVKNLNLGHENDKEVQDKILHLSSQDQDYLNKMIKSLEQLGGR